MSVWFWITAAEIFAFGGLLISATHSEKWFWIIMIAAVALNLSGFLEGVLRERAHLAAHNVAVEATR